jgi:hypothetical protein
MNCGAADAMALAGGLEPCPARPWETGTDEREPGETKNLARFIGQVKPCLPHQCFDTIGLVPDGIFLKPSSDAWGCAESPWILCSG